MYRANEYIDAHAKPVVEISREEYLKEAKPELWRPLPHEILEREKNIIQERDPQPEEYILNETAKPNEGNEFEFSSIQCAQRQPSHCIPFPSPNEVPHDNKFNEIIDLDPTSQASQHSQLTPTAKGNNIIGRRLFHDTISNGDDEDNECPKLKDKKQKQQSSPEMQYLGEKSFNNMCNKMSASLVIEPNDVKLHEIITTLCDDEEFRYKCVINIDNCRVTLDQIGNSMKPNGWVEAWVINAFCRKLFKDNHPRRSNKHWFFHTSSEYFLEKWPNDFMKNKWRNSTIKLFYGADSARKLHLSHRTTCLNDCGIFTMKYMEFYCPRNPSSLSFSASDVPGFRVKIVVDSVFNQYNSEHDHMQLFSSFDLKEYNIRQSGM
ncbi:unnamed protein product [Alopecurus aequalis]